MHIYQTQHDLEEEERIACLYSQIEHKDLEQTENLHPYDRIVKVPWNGNQVAYLEIKKKNGPFKKYEVIPENKWQFAKDSEFVCYFLVEREGHAKLFDISHMVHQQYEEKNRAWKGQIKRADRPDCIWDVIRFFTSEGVDLY